MVVKILDLYSGMGGLSLGFALGLEGVEILGLDIDERAVETYNLNLSDLNARAETQDALKWEPKGEYDLVMGGVPCQPYSTANTRKRGIQHELYPTLPRFFDIVLELKPKVFLMENVKGLMTRRHKHLLHEQLNRVRGEYSVKHQLLNAAHYGVPQRRERLFVLGIRKDLGIVPSFPAPTHGEVERVTLDGKLYKWVTVREAIGDLLVIPPVNYPMKLVQTNPEHGKPISLDEPSRTVKVDERGGDFTFDTMLIPLTPEQVERIRQEREDVTRHLAKMEFPDSLDKPSRTVSSHTIEGAKRETIVVPVTEHVMTERGGWDNPKSDWGSRVMDVDKPSNTITEKHRSGQLVSEAFRRLTVREALRLQSFPDWWVFPESVSISRKYKLVGEAVSPILAYRLAVHIGRLLGLKTREPPREVEWKLPFFSRSFADYPLKGGSCTG